MGLARPPPHPPPSHPQSPPPPPGCDPALVPSLRTDVVTALRGEVAAVVAVVPSMRAVVVAVRGTIATSIPDWILDGEAWQQRWAPPNSSTGGYAGAMVHHGFATAFAALQPPLDAAVGRARASSDGRGLGLIVTGHSLGGSVAALFAAHYAALGTELEFLSYGQPRTGNVAFEAALAKALRSRGPAAYRVVNKRDVVPHLPPNGTTLGYTYRHMPTEVWLTPPDGAPRVCDGSGEDASCSDSVPVLRLRPADHTSYFGLDAGPCAR